MSGSGEPWAQIAAGLEDRLDQILERTLERVWANPALEEWTRDDTRAPAADIARPTIAREVEAMRRRELPQACPEEELAVARAAVAYGAPVVVPLHCYRAGQAALFEAWLDEVERRELADDARRELLKEGAAFLNDYVDRCAAWVELEYERERDRVVRGEEQRRVAAVRDLLEGSTPDAEALGYELDGQHAALVVWGRDGDAALRQLAARTDARQLVVSVDPRTWWVWVAVGSDAAARALASWEPPAGTFAAVGGPAAGVEGFRRAHSEALDARRVAAYRPDRVVRYEDIALEALAARDEQRARDFVARELDPLLAGGPREQRLLATLDAYFLAGQNASSAAARLGVHERTVANRLRAIEGRLGGQPVDARRAELEVALRLHRLLAGERP
jgi:hypothetical protein